MSQPYAENKQFLIVENVKQSRDALRIFAFSCGAKTVDCSHYAPEIVTLCSKTKYDVILLGYDLGDGKKNGQQILEELRVKNHISRQCIILMITAEVSQAMVLAALEHKPDEYLAKPYTQKDISTRLERCFAKKSAMSAIYNAMDKNHYEKVITLCQIAIEKNSPYKLECLGILSRQYFELGRFDEAKAIYNDYKASENCQWATIGLAKIAIEERDLTQAKSYLQAVIHSHPMYLSAYDWLAKVYVKDDSPIEAEKVLEDALLISPRSVARLKDYAQLCVKNENYQKATEAYYKTTELAYHSVHKQPENALNFAEALLEYNDSASLTDAKQLNAKAFKALNTMTSDFMVGELKVASLLLMARLHRKVQEDYKAAEVLKDAEKLYKKHKDSISTKHGLTIAKSFKALDKNAISNLLISQLIETHPDDFDLHTELQAFNDITITEEEKISAQNNIALANRLYKNNEYHLAIDKLNKALSLYPYHLGIKLNILQIIYLIEEQGSARKKDIEQAMSLKTELDLLSTTSEAHKRYVSLVRKYKK